MLQHAKHDGSAKASASLLLCVFVAGWVLFAVAAGGACAAGVDLAAEIALERSAPTAVEAEYSGALLIHETVKDLNGQPAMNAQGYARAAYTYTEDGQLLTESFYDVEGKPVIIDRGYASSRRGYARIEGQDKLALLSEEFFDAQGAYAQIPGGYARKRNVYEEGRIMSTAYYDKDGGLTRPAGGYALLKYAYAADGTLAGKAYFGAGGQKDPVTGPEGGAVVEYAYQAATDPSGRRADRLLSMRVYDAQRRPVLGVSKFHRQENTYDEHGNLTRTDYYGTEGERVKALDGYASITHAYDPDHRVTETCYYNAAERLTKTVTGYARVTYEYYKGGDLHLETYYGADNERTMVSDGYSRVEHEYNGRGFDYRKTYYDIADQYTMCMDGYARTEWTYKGDGSISGQSGAKPWTLARPLILTQKFFDQRMELTTVKAGHSGYVNVWNEHNQLKETSYRNAQWDLTINEEVHYAIIRYRYEGKDPYAQPAQEAYFDEKGNPIDARDGYQARTMAYGGPTGRLLVREAFWYADGRPDESVVTASHEVRYAYDSRQNIILEQHYDQGGSPILCASGYAALSREYNASGKLLREYFLDAQSGGVIANGQYAARVHRFDPSGR